jgi:hypothetical protein
MKRNKRRKRYMELSWKEPRLLSYAWLDCFLSLFHSIFVTWLRRCLTSICVSWRRKWENNISIIWKRLPWIFDASHTNIISFIEMSKNVEKKVCKVHGKTKPWSSLRSRIITMNDAQLSGRKVFPHSCQMTLYSSLKWITTHYAYCTQIEIIPSMMIM